MNDALDWTNRISETHPAASVEFMGGDMKRDMDLVREILFAIEAKEDLVPETVEIDGRGDLQVAEHVALLFEAGYIKGHKTEHPEEGHPPIIDVINLTWAGHEFAATISQPDIWDRTKATLAASGRWSLALMAKTAEAYALEKLRQVTGMDIN
ncbi:DUF2513 domain-containing protein [Pelagibacterium sp. H642]|uniref:DUF2513 domain-containing protein n=1 Tax=Pelagibacterium sp. H642 TaxID=1881069 RepID=UPI0028169BF4|nr:DUF2513 domain-containing protein [Pelagibacterium sp. H642]WMT92471.1 DUF2513 domain-containing protein [Pelagibacterium sp. H642]